MQPEETMNTAYEIGQLKATVGSMKADVVDIRIDMKAQNVKLDELLAEKNARKGGMAVLFLLATAIGSLLTLAVSWLKK